MSKSTRPRGWRPTRRGFLIGLGVTGGALVLGWQFGLPALRLKLAETFAEPGASFGGVDAPPTAWFTVHPDNTITLHMPKVEMGQGIHTALAQIAADELDAAWDQLQIVSADTLRGPVDTFGTAGSLSVMSMWQPLREAAATLRQMLIQAAAAHWNVSPAGLTAHNGVVTLQADPSQAMTYGEIVQMAGNAWEVPEEAPPLKPVDAFRYIGQPMPRVDFQDKLTGKAIYGLDVRVEGMLYGAAAYPPTVAGKLKSARPGRAPEVPGVVQVVIEDGFAGVVATSRAAAEAALAELELEWEPGPLLGMDEIRATVTVGQGSGTVIQKRGDAPRVMARESAGRRIQAEYRTPLAAHAHLEPQAALVHVREDRVEAWVSTQMPRLVQTTLAEVLERDADEIQVTATYLGGGFGRKAGTEAAVEAARLSRAVGRPVHVGWTRPKEFRAGYLRPPTHHVLQAVLGEDGRIQAMEHQQASADVAFLFLPAAFRLIAGADFGATRGAPILYHAPHVRTVAWRTPLPFPTGWWRGLGLLPNTFAIESFLDELAHAAGADPLDFRLAHLAADEQSTRLATVLQTAASLAGWPHRPPGRGLGMAACMDAGTAVAQVAEVSVEDGRIRVHRVSCAIDPGLPINPDGIAAQSQGAIIMGLSSTLLEAVRVEEGRIVHNNFDTYPLLTMADAPDIQVEVIRSGDRPYGMGEPPIGPIAAAVANAVFDATGIRLRTLPLNRPTS